MTKKILEKFEITKKKFKDDLLSYFVFMSSFESYGWKWDANASWKEYYSSSLTGGTIYDLRVSPFYFLYGGSIGSGSLAHAGFRSSYWSSTVTSDAFAYRLYFDWSNVYPASNGSYRYAGFSIRCLA